MALELLLTFMVVVPEVETTSALPPDAGVLKARTGVPFEQSAYQVLLLHELLLLLPGNPGRLPPELEEPNW